MENNNPESNLEQLKKRAKEKKTPSLLDLLPFYYLPNIDFLDKIKALKTLPDSAYEDPKKTKQLEAELVRAGQSKLARYTRYASYRAAECKSDTPNLEWDYKWCERVVDLDQQKRHIMQEDKYMRERWEHWVKAFKDTQDKNPKTIESYKAHLRY